MRCAPLHASISTDVAPAPVLPMQPFLGETASPQTSWHSGPLFYNVPCAINTGAVIQMYLLGSPQSMNLCSVSSCGLLGCSPCAVRETSLMRGGSSAYPCV